MKRAIEISWEKLWPIANVLNEVCHGIRIESIEDKIGATEEELFLLLKKIKKYKVKESEFEIKKTIDVDENEIGILKKSLKEVSKQIDEWEFQTRIGVPLEEIKATLELF